MEAPTGCLDEFVIWPFVAPKPVPDIIIQHNGNQGQPCPSCCELRAYLAKDVSRKTRVIPDSKTEPAIENTAGRKFGGGHDGRTDDDLPEQRHVPGQPVIQTAKQ